MGYLTTYTVSSAPDAFIAEIKENHGNVFGYACKWHSHEQDIVRAMQSTWTKCVEIHGEGEEQGDVWDKVLTLAEDGTVTVETYPYKLSRGADPQRKTWSAK